MCFWDGDGTLDREEEQVVGRKDGAPTPAEIRHASDLVNHLDKVAFLAKSLSDPNRLRILLAVSSGRRSVGQIVEELGLSQPLVSHHLKELRRALLVTVERRGPFVFYELSDPRVVEALDRLRSVACDLLERRDSF
jgi:DNA-binding transcriptional ArsR family regulator